MNDVDEDIRALLRAGALSLQPRSDAAAIRAAGDAGRRSALRWGALAVVAGVVAIGAVSFAHGFGGQRRPPVATGEAGILLVHSQTPAGLAAELSGTLTRAGDCLRVAGTPVVWPSNARWDASHQSVTLTQGGKEYVIAVGEPLPGLGGGFMPLDMVAKFLDPATISAATRCAGEGQDVLLVN